VRHVADLMRVLMFSGVERGARIADHLQLPVGGEDRGGSRGVGSRGGGSGSGACAGGGSGGAGTGAAGGGGGERGWGVRVRAGVRVCTCVCTAMASRHGDSVRHDLRGGVGEEVRVGGGGWCW
jgi:hypothetical protein